VPCAFLVAQGHLWHLSIVATPMRVMQAIYTQIAIGYRYPYVATRFIKNRKMLYLRLHYFFMRAVWNSGVGVCAQ